MPITTHTAADNAWVITGPTSGIGYRTALELAAHGTVVLVGRSASRLSEVKKTIESRGGHATTVTCDLSDVQSARRAANEIATLDLPIRGLLNNAGIMPLKAGTSPQGWDLAFATDHLGPFTLTEGLIPSLPDDANVVFTCSAVEDPTRKPAVQAGFRGGRYISAEASARGEWQPGGSSHAGYDAYATSKQGNLATVFTFAREYPRLRFRGVEPGFIPGSGLSRDAHPALQLIARYLIAPLAPMMKGGSTLQRAGRLLTAVLTDPSGATGVYYDEKGNPMQASEQVRDPAFSGRYITETRALLASIAPVETRT
jgi:NAD(P)-dependent dehydrogenase (short-subunit alcohol dehydrogenase family)